MFNILSFLSYPHIQIALVVGLLLAIGAALLSPFLVLNGEALIADGLAHTSFLGFAVGILLMKHPIYIAIIVSILATILIKLIVTKLGTNADSAIGIVSALSFAIGLIIIDKSQGFNISIESIMAGSILMIEQIYLIITPIIVALIALFVILSYRQLFSIVYDFEYAQFSKIKAETYSYVLAILTAVFIVIGVRLIGTLMISAIIIFPAFISSILKMSFKKTFITGIIISIITMISGIVFAHFLDVSTGAFVVIMNIIVLLLVLIFQTVKKRVKT